jgi:hypothetical protein
MDALSDYGALELSEQTQHLEHRLAACALDGEDLASARSSAWHRNWHRTASNWDK